MEFFFSLPGLLMYNWQLKITYIKVYWYTVKWLTQANKLTYLSPHMVTFVYVCVVTLKSYSLVKCQVYNY